MGKLKLKKGIFTFDIFAGGILMGGGDPEDSHVIPATHLPPPHPAGPFPSWPRIEPWKRGWGPQ